MRLMYVLLSVLSGVVSGFSFHNAHLSILIWFSLVPFLFVIDKAKKIWVLLYSFICGVSFFLTAIFWVGYVTQLGLFVLTAYLALYWVVFGYGAKFLMVHTHRFLVLPFLWIMLEFLREHIYAGFGWAILGYSQYTYLPIIQAADLLGVKFISWCIVMSNVVLFEIFKKKKIFIKETYVFCIVMLLSVSYSLFKVHTIRSNDSFKVSLIQTNIPQRFKWDPLYAEVIQEKLLRLGGKTPADSLLVYPEASYPLLAGQEPGHIEKFFSPLKKDILVGAIEEKGALFYNKAILFNARAERVLQYRKIKLVPFGEYVPLRKYLEFIKVINMIGDISPGTEKEIFPCKGKTFAVLICFEDIFPFLVASFSRAADFLINITNDAWFYGQPQSYQHLGIMAFRAVENRISIVRCANTGISGWVSFKGEVATFKKEGKETFVEGVYTTDVPLNEKRSFYNRFPELFVIFGMITLFIYWRK